MGGSLADPHSEQFETRSRNTVYYGQHHSCSILNELRLVPVSSSSRDDRSYSYFISLKESVELGLFRTQSLQCMGRCPVEVKDFVI